MFIRLSQTISPPYHNPRDKINDRTDQFQLCENNDNIEYRYYYNTAFSHKITKEAQSQRPLSKRTTTKTPQKENAYKKLKPKKRKLKMKMFRRIKREGSNI
jgi:hypothetical protein